MRWWLSFARKSECLGIVLAEAEGVVEAAAECSKHGCNPGGEILAVMTSELPEEAPAQVREWLEQAPLYRLFRPEDLPDFLLPQTLRDSEKQGLHLPLSSEHLEESSNKKSQ